MRPGRQSIPSAARALRPLTQLRCSLRFAAHGAAFVATGGSRLLVEQPHAGAWGLGARRYVALYGGACYDRTWRSSRPCYARRLNFHVRLVCAHSPNSPAGVASTPFWGGGGWGGTSASPYWAVRLCLVIFRSRRCLQSLRFPHCIVGLLYCFECFALLFASSAAASAFAFSCFAAFILTLRGGIEHRTLRCCNFNSVLLLPLPLCAGQALAAWA